MLIKNIRKINYSEYKDANSEGGSFKLNTANIASTIAQIDASFQELEEATAKAKMAAEMAINGAGGTGTGVGAAISGAILDINDAELKAAKTQLEEMKGNLSKISSLYSDSNSELIAAINTIAEKGAGALAAAQNPINNGSGGA